MPTNMSAMSTIRMLRANTGGDNAQPPLPPEPSYALGIGGMDGVNRKVWTETCFEVTVFDYITIDIHNEVTTNRP